MPYLVREEKYPEGSVLIFAWDYPNEVRILSYLVEMEVVVKVVEAFRQ